MEKSALVALPDERMLDEMLTTGLLNFFFTGLLLAGLPEPLMGEGRVNLEASFSFWASSLMVSIMDRVLTPDFCILDVVYRFVRVRHSPAIKQQAILLKGNVSFYLVCHTNPINLSCIWHGLKRAFSHSIVCCCGWLCNYLLWFCLCESWKE